MLSFHCNDLLLLVLQNESKTVWQGGHQVTSHGPVVPGTRTAVGLVVFPAPRAVEPSDGWKVIGRLNQSSLKHRGHYNAVSTWGNGQILGKSAGLSIIC